MPAFIAIDPGHGGRDSGSVNVAIGIKEKDIVLSIARFLKDVLQARGHTTLMTRDADTRVSLSHRVSFAQAFNAEVFVSIHCNAARVAAAAGIETFHDEYSEDGKTLATAVQQNLMLAFSDHKNRGVKASNFYVLRHSVMPACLVEAEFISNSTQAVFLKDPVNQEKIARAIANGIETFFYGAK